MREVPVTPAPAPQGALAYKWRNAPGAQKCAGRCACVQSLSPQHVCVSVCVCVCVGHLSARRHSLPGLPQRSHLCPLEPRQGLGPPRSFPTGLSLPHPQSSVLPPPCVRSPEEEQPVHQVSLALCPDVGSDPDHKVPSRPNHVAFSPDASLHAVPLSHIWQNTAPPRTRKELGRDCFVERRGLHGVPPPPKFLPPGPQSGAVLGDGSFKWR